MNFRDYKEIMELLGYVLVETENYYRLKRIKNEDIRTITICKDCDRVFSFTMTDFDENDWDAMNFTKAFANTPIEERYKERLEVI